MQPRETKMTGAGSTLKSAVSMSLKLIAVLVSVGVPVCAQAQNPSVAKVSKGDAQMVVKIISGDKAKSQTYCDIKKLDEQIAQADEKKDSKMADELSQKVGELEKTLGPEYIALIDGLQDVDPETDEVGEEVMLTLLVLDRLCTR
jgi:hypothetical protein